LTASLRGQRSAPGIDGGFVIFGERTKTYTKAQFSELIELIYAFGAQHEVIFGDEHART
jgi:ADP-heptose:LPS heptosyltransferase